MHPYLCTLHERPLTLVKCNLDGDFFITCGKDGGVSLCRTDTCERVGTYQPPEMASGGGATKPAIYAVDITHDCTRVVTAGADGKLNFYTFEGDYIRDLNHGGILKYCEWNQKPGDQNKVVTCNDKFKTSSEVVPNRIMVYQFEPMKKLLTIADELPMKCTKVKWGPFDETLVSIFEEGTVVIWDSKSGEQIHLMQAHTSAVTSMNFTEDRMLMITSSKDHVAKLWAMDEYECVKTYKSDRPLNDAAISPLYNAAEDPKMHILLGGGQDAKDVTTTASSSGKFESVLWHMVYEEEIGQVKGHFGPINSVAWFPDGRGYITGGEDGYVRVHHLDAEYFTSKKFE